MTRIFLVGALLVTACSSSGGPSGGKQDLAAPAGSDLGLARDMASTQRDGASPSDGMTSTGARDMARTADAGTGSCAGFLDCFQACPSCLNMCKAALAPASAMLAKAYVECAAASCFQQPNPQCASWDATDITCDNCERYGLMIATSSTCPSQLNACQTDR